jgi:hypothetical protein
VNRAVSTGKDSSNGVANNFNLDDIETGFAVTRAFGQEVGAFVAAKAANADRIKAALKQELLDPGADPALVEQLKTELGEAATWVSGGTSRQVLTALAAAASGNVTGSGLQMVQGALVNFVQQKGAALVGDLVHGSTDEAGNFKEGIIKEGSPEQAALQAIVAAGGSMAMGQDPLSGAAGAAASSLLTNLFKVDEGMSQADKDTQRDLILTLVTGMAASLDGDATSANAAAFAALDNNADSSKNSFKKTYADAIQWLGTHVVAPGLALSKGVAVGVENVAIHNFATQAVAQATDVVGGVLNTAFNTDLFVPISDMGKTAQGLVGTPYSGQMLPMLAEAVKGDTQVLQGVAIGGAAELVSNLPYGSLTGLGTIATTTVESVATSSRSPAVASVPTTTEVSTIQGTGVVTSGDGIPTNSVFAKPSQTTVVETPVSPSTAAVPAAPAATSESTASVPAAPATVSPNPTLANSPTGVPPSILDAQGQLPTGIGGPGTPIPMPPSVTPNATAEAFAKAAFNGQTPDVVTPILSGNSWVAKLPDGTVVTFRVAGDAGVSTMSSTATVEINSQAVRVINSGNVAKFKFPSR